MDGAVDKLLASVETIEDPMLLGDDSAVPFTSTSETGAHSCASSNKSSMCSRPRPASEDTVLPRLASDTLRFELACAWPTCPRRTTSGPDPRTPEWMVFNGGVPRCRDENSHDGWRSCGPPCVASSQSGSGDTRGGVPGGCAVDRPSAGTVAVAIGPQSSGFTTWPWALLSKLAMLRPGPSHSGGCFAGPLWLTLRPTGRRRGRASGVGARGCGATGAGKKSSNSGPSSERREEDGKPGRANPWWPVGGGAGARPWWPSGGTAGNAGRSMLRRTGGGTACWAPAAVACSSSGTESGRATAGPEPQPSAAVAARVARAFRLSDRPPDPCASVTARVCAQGSTAREPALRRVA
mmetsp:Transcript_80637/g.184777  ORF Transcript_80637/g.184777 Transcript_80637/m.184777 type:complete len:351 (+) Transcript_80637:808-1860(+)